MKNYFRMLVVAAVSAFLLSGPTPANAADTGVSVSANVGIFSKYRWRGLDQSAREPAIQGGFDLAHTSGLYIGTWMSNVDFAGNADSVSSELDFYGGFGFEAANGVGVDLNFTQFLYPGGLDSLNYDFQEWGIGLSKDFGAAAVSAGFNYSDEFYGKSGDAQYIQGGVDIPLPASLGLSAHVGHQTVDKNSTYGVDDYTDWSVGGSATVGGLDLSVTYVDTDLDISTVTTHLVGREEAVIFGMSKSF